VCLNYASNGFFFIFFFKGSKYKLFQLGLIDDINKTVTVVCVCMSGWVWSEYENFISKGPKGCFSDKHVEILISSWFFFYSMIVFLLFCFITFKSEATFFNEKKTKLRLWLWRHVAKWNLIQSNLARFVINEWGKFLNTKLTWLSRIGRLMT